MLIKNAVVAGNNNQVEIGIRGIIIKDPDDPMNYLVAKNGVLAITNDGGNTWKKCHNKVWNNSGAYFWQYYNIPRR